MRDNKKSILFVEPDRELRNTTSKMLRDRGYCVIAVEDGETALDVLFRNAVDLVVSALRMPNLGGLGLMEAIRRRKKNVPVIFVTAFGDVESYMDLMNMGAFEYLNKPVGERELLRVIENALGNTGNASTFLCHSQHDFYDNIPQR